VRGLERHLPDHPLLVPIGPRAQRGSSTTQFSRLTSRLARLCAPTTP
jgi:hypothetical protein